MKKVLAIVLAIVSIISCFSLMAGAEDNDITFEIINDDTLIISGSGELTAEIVRSYYEYMSLGSISEIVIENGITSIGEGAFSSPDYSRYPYFFEVKKITVPNSVEVIKSCAFSCCEDLQVVRLGYGVKSISESAFSCCASLEDISVPESVEYIGDGAFFGCCNLKNITIPGSVKRIGLCVFSDCLDLADVEILDGVEKIDFGAFQNCLSLSRIIIPSSVTTIESNVFEQSRHLTIWGYLGTEAEDFAANNHMAFVDVNAHQHTPIKYEEDTPATCTTEGFQEAVCCEECGEMIERWRIIPATGHNYKTIITEPTCTSEGYTTHACVNCGDSYIDSYTNKKEHTLTTIDHKCATCEETGYTGDIYCVTCNSIIEHGKEIPKIEESVTKSLGNILNYISKFLMRIFGMLRGFNLI